MKKIIILLAMLVLMFGLSSIARADTAPTCTVVNPSPNTAYNGTIVFNASMTSNGTGEFNVTGINFTVSSAVVGSHTLGGVNQSYYNATVDTSTITDVKQTTVTASIIINYTHYSGSCTSTGVDFDNTAPTCSMTVSQEIIDVLNPLEIDCSGSSDTTDIMYNITFCTVDSTTCTQQSELSTDDGIHIFGGVETGDLGEGQAGCRVTDEVNKETACTNVTITIKGGDDVPPITCGDSVCDEGETFENCPSDCEEEEEEEKELPTILFVILGVAVVTILIIVFIVMQSSKKKRKRR